MIGYREASFALMGAVALCLPVNAGRNAGFGPFTIKVEIEDVTQGVFQAVEGLASESLVIPVEENGQVQDEPGVQKGSRLILRRPYDPSLSGLWLWRQSILDGAARKRDGHIFIFDAEGRQVAHWRFGNGWPCRWEVPQLRSGSNQPAEEVVEIIHTGLTLEPLGGS